MSPAASKTTQPKAAAKPAIVMLADASGKAKPMSTAAAEEKSPKATKTRSRAAGLPKGTDLKAAADELLAAAEGKTKTTKTAKPRNTTKGSAVKTSKVGDPESATTAASKTAAKSTTAKAATYRN